MKLKGINPVEQHLEKGVLALCGLAFVGAVAWQFLAGPRVKVNNVELSPADAFQPAKDAAATLVTKLDSGSPPLPEIPTISVTSLDLSSPKRADGPRVALGPAPAIRSGAGAQQTVAASFAIPAIKAPASVVAAEHRAAISPIEKLRIPELAPLLPEEQPFDKASVSVEGVFDGVALRQALETDPDGAGPLEAVQLSWWRDLATNAPLIDIIGIEVERQTLRNPDGSTPAAEEIVAVPPPPGRVNLLAEYKERVKSAGDVPPILDEAAQMLDEIQRPEFYSIIAGPDWTPPSEVVVVAGDDDKAGDIRRQRALLKEVNRKIQRNEELLGGGGARGRQEADRDEPRSGGGRGGPGRGGPGRAPQQGDRGREDQGTDDNQRETLERNLARQRAERERILKRLADLGDKTNNQPEQAGGDDAAAPLLENASVRLWTHDMTVRPGAQYRYRMRVHVNNPLFGRGLQDGQKNLAEQQLAVSPWSDWSAPVTVDRDNEFFVVSAVESDPLTSRPRVTSELFTFYYGYYRSTTASAEPGDSFHATVSLPKLMLADMTKLQQAVETGGSIDLQIRPADAPATTGRPAPTGPGRANPRGGRPPAQDAQQDAILSVPAKQSIERDVPSILLGVRTVPTTDRLGQAMTRAEAVLRDLAGRVVRVPAGANRENEVYQRLAASVRAGKDAMKAPEPEEDPGRTNPPPPRETRQPRTPPPGGGGGGGGG
ncbi:MAG TPA: hypothetical protein VD971_06255 [Phycisphaerales bacterium]|nr:hypothetical protein [Phycisphaerales bacterium]